MKFFYQTFVGRALSIAIILAIIFYCIHNFTRSLGQDSDQLVPVLSASSTVSTASSSVSIPARIIIPQAKVDANVLQMGVTASGNMEAPHNFTDAGWYKYGPKPGEKGNAVIDAHVDNGLGFPAVFYNLKDLKSGDLVYVIDERGATTTFKVVETAVYGYKSAPLEKIFGPTDTHMLNLITCAGTWIPSEKTNNKRLVVFTEQVL